MHQKTEITFLKDVFVICELGEHGNNYLNKSDTFSFIEKIYLKVKNPKGAPAVY